MDNEKLGVTAENEESKKDIFDKIMSIPVLNNLEGFYK